jgi:3'(2'), 5'-bisphosphate nucleotidase
MQLPFDLINEISLLARQAGEAILNIYQHPNYLDVAKVQIKADQSPVTQADKLAHDLIVSGLDKLNKKYDLEAYIVSEEDEETHQSNEKTNRLDAKTIWLVDPLDGTKEFIAGTHEFTVNIALVHEHQAILGVIYVPYYDLLYYAELGKGAFLQAPQAPVKQLILPQTNINTAQPIRVISSRRHGVVELDSVLSKLENYEITYLGSSWKLCKIAEGQADLYPRLGPTSEWDTAAGQIILAEAGGEIRDFSGNLISYNTKKSLDNPHFMAISQPRLFKKICG